MPDFSFEFVGAPPGVEEVKAGVFSLREGEVAGADGVEESGGLAFHAVGRGGARSPDELDAEIWHQVQPRLTS